MPWIDIVLLVLLAGFTITGLLLGFVQTAGNVLGTIVGVYVAGVLVDPAMSLIHSTSGITRVVTFIVLYGLASRLFDVAFWFVRKTFGFLAWIPLIPTLNHIVGAVLGLLEGVIAVSACVFIAAQFLPEALVHSTVATSAVAGYLLALMTVVKFLLPQALQLLRRT